MVNLAGDCKTYVVGSGVRQFRVDIGSELVGRAVCPERTRCLRHSPTHDTPLSTLRCSVETAERIELIPAQKLFTGPILHCAVRKFGHLQRPGHFPLELCYKLWSPRQVDCEVNKNSARRSPHPVFVRRPPVAAIHTPSSSDVHP